MDTSTGETMARAHFALLMDGYICTVHCDTAHLLHANLQRATKVFHSVVSVMVSVLEIDHHCTHIQWKITFRYMALIIYIQIRYVDIIRLI